jgi:PleD family two-component response regulator
MAAGVLGATGPKRGGSFFTAGDDHYNLPWCFASDTDHGPNTEADMSDKSRILIADDNQPNCELLEVYLAEVDCDVEIAVDGQDTLDKVASFKPDVILLDVMMPKLSGFEVCRKLKDAPETRGIMVLMVTALNELGDIERAVQAGTDDFLSKPVNKLELVKRVENMLRLKDVSDENERLRRYIEQMEDPSERRA